MLEECSNCTLVWQRFAPAEALLTRLYESWASGDGGLERHDNLAYYRSAAEEILLVLELVGKPPGEVSVLDFGMGWGRWPRLAAAFGCRSSGVELGRQQAEYARAHGVDVIAFDDLPADAFDFVNTEQVFEHLVEPREVVRRLGASLVDGGWLKVAVPSGDGIVDRLRNPDWTAPRRSSNSLNAVAPLEHLNCFTKRALVELGEQGSLRQDAPGTRALYATTIGLWPARRLARNVARPPVRRLAAGASFFRR